MAHLGGGNQVQDAVHHAKASAEDGHDGQLLAGQGLEGAGGDRGLHLHIGQGEITGGLVALQRGDFGDDLAELLHAGILVPQDGQLMLQQRMIQHMYLFHKP